MGADDGESGGGASGAGQRGGEDVTEMQAGRELDALIARRVFGLHAFVTPGLAHWPDGLLDGHCRTNADGTGGMFHLPHYSTDIRAAWQLAKWMTEHGSSVTLDWGEDNDCWECSWITGGERYTAVSKHPALAICRAALAAVTP